MSHRLSEYFVREAGEYLEQLEQLLALPAEPAAGELLRLSRGVRGSAQMAGADPISRVAERLEEAARRLAARSLAWNDGVRLAAAATVADLRALLPALDRWGAPEERRVEQAVARWEALDGGRGAEPAVVPVSELFYDDAGPHILSPGGEEPVVPIEALLLRGERALHEALALRPRVEALLHDGRASQLALVEAVDELFALVELGLRGDAAPA